MPATTLSQASRFNPGADLWIVPGISESHHTLQIDWYLNFQISQAQTKVPINPSQNLQMILEQTELKYPEIKTSNHSLMILAVNSLPCRWVVAVENSFDLKTWTKDLFSIWKNLAQPSLRVYLPPNAKTNEFLQ